jgi:hypothetical protein
VDEGIGSLSDIPLSILGFASLTLSADTDEQQTFDIRPLLRERKSLKYMARQDRMATYAALKAVEQCAVDIRENGEQTGVYFAIGRIPFDQHPLDVLYEKSVEEGELSMYRFATDALPSLNPLLTFKCLPNMPAYHVSYNLQARGPYFVTYPGPGQWFQALQQAADDLLSGRVRFAIVGAVADQLNPLVRHHTQRTAPATVPQLVDAASVLILGNYAEGEQAQATIRGLSLSYTAPKAFASCKEGKVKRAIAEIDSGTVDPSLFVARHLQRSQSGTYPLKIDTCDGLHCELTLEVS